MIEIKYANKEHLPDIFHIEQECFKIPWSNKDLEKDILENKMSIYIVALYDGKVVGYAGMWHVITEGHITNIAVLEEYRNKGIGTKFLYKFDEIAKEKEMIGLTLEVRVNNLNAQKLYLKHGYKVEGMRKNYYSDTKEDALIMWKYFD